MTDAVTETTIPLPDPNAVMAMFAAHIKNEHGTELDDTPTGGKLLEQEAFRLELEPSSQGLIVRLAAPNDQVLIFMKEEVVEHVGEIDATAAANIRWTNETAVIGALPANFKVLKVVRSTPVFEGLQRVTLSHDDVGSLVADGIHLRLMMPLQRGRTPIWPRMAENGTPVWPEDDDKLHARIVTIRQVRVADGEIDIDIVHHDGGLISDWAHEAKPGSTVGIMGPAGNTTIPDVGGVFLAADGTGLPALSRMLENVCGDATGHVVVAVPDGFDVSTYLPQTGLEVHVLSPERFEHDVVSLAEQLTASGETGYAFFAGEFQNAQDLRALFKKKLGLDKTTQLSTAYWRRGVPGYGS